MRKTVLALAAMAFAAPMAAQQARPNPEELRARIAERFMMTYRQQAGLTDEQFQRFQAVARASWEARMEEDRRRRELFQTLEGQMRPGMAADAAVVTRALDGLMALETQRAQRAQADMNRYAEFLSPVQRAQLLIMMTRFERQVEDIMRERMERMPMQRRNPPNPDMH